MAGMSSPERLFSMCPSLLSVLIFALVAAACGGHHPMDDDPPYENSTYTDAFMLYVEEIILPEVIFEDEDVYFQLRVSADSNPDALKCLSFDSWASTTGVFALYVDPQERWMVDAFVATEIDPQAEPSDLLPVLVPGMPVGEWVCVVRGAADRSLGGKEIEYQITPSSGPLTPAADLRELRFTVNVIPRPEE